MHVNKVSLLSPTSKNIKRAALSAAGTLAVLAGSSMSGGLPPRNLGEPVNDTLMHKLRYTWDMITGKRDGSGTYTDLKESVTQKVADTAEDESDSILDHVIDWLDDIL